MSYQKSAIRNRLSRTGQPIRPGSRSAWLLRLSLVANFLFLAAAIGIAFHYRERLLQAFLDWKGKAAIVFLGDSITAQGEWNVLLGRCDVRNSGVPGLGVCHLKDEIDRRVLRYAPELCVVMGGINDLTILERTAQETIGDYRILLLKLRSAGVKTAVQLTLYEKQSPATKVRVDSLNSWLVSYCDSLGIPAADPNRWLSDQNGLKDGFARDRTHLTGEAYRKWASELKPLLASWR